MAVNTIDLLELRHNVTDHVVYIATSVTPLEVYGLIIGGILLFGAYEWHRHWMKGKGLRMAVKHERQRLREILSQGISDMILDWEVKGTVSNQEGDQLYSELSKKLDLPDLIPRQRRYKIVKAEIKTRLRSPKHNIKKPNIPGGMPEVVVRKKFRQTTGSLIRKFWKAS